MAQSIYFITNNPYANVNWSTVQRVKFQTHDHNTNITRLTNYNNAGYQTDAYMSYNGNQIGDPPNSNYWKEHRWPLVPTWFTQSQLDALTNIKVWYQCYEQVGSHHWTSPFIDAYIEYVLSSPGTNEYTVLADGMQLCRDNGGLPVMAHPFEGTSQIPFSGEHAQEIYNAFYENQRLQSISDLNPLMISRWDAVLQTNPTVYGVCVNDHFGPDGTSSALRDSGHTDLLVAAVTYDGIKTAFTDGAFFGINDAAVTKDAYPTINSVTVLDAVITVDTSDAVTWIANGATVGTGTTFDVQTLPTGSKYLRAEVSNGTSTVYVQPFAISESVVPDIISNLELYLPLAESSGVDTKDLSPNDRTCTLISMAFETPGVSIDGPFGKGIDRPNKPDVIECGNIGLPDADQTIAIWVKNPTEPNTFIVSSRNGSAGGLSLFTAASKLYAQIGVSSQGPTGVLTIWDDTWHMLSLSYSKAAGKIEFYLDGILQFTDTTLTGTWTSTVLTQIGDRDGEPSATSYSFAHPRIYSRALSAEDHLALFKWRGAVSGFSQQQLLIP